MNRQLSAGLCAAALISSASAAVLAQSTPEDRIQKLESRLDAMDRQHREELQKRDAEIARLKARLDAQPAPTATRPAPAKGEPDLLEEIDRAGMPAAAPSDAARDAVAADAAARSNPYQLGLKSPISFNPDIAVVSDFLGSYSSNRSNNALNRFDVREIELDLRAAVHPKADAVAILAFARDVENPPFPDADEPPEGPESSVEVEEAYLFLHDFGIPNLTAKIGRYHVRFGRQNVLHLHDLPTSDPPLVNQAFLAPESLSDAGLSLSYVIPPKWIGGQYVEVIGEVLAGEGGGSESPTLRGDLSVDSPAFNTHILWNHDLVSNWNLELGGTWLTGHASDDNSQNVNLYGADATLIHTDPSGRFFNQLFQAEAIYGDTYDEDGVKQHSWGMYLLGQQQLSRDWFAGLRFDYTQNPNATDEETYAINPYLSFYWSEFLRFRLQYQYKGGDVPEENNVFLQATWIFGAHPPHPYWSMR